MKEFFKPTYRKALLATGLAILSSISALIAYRYFDALEIASWLFFPLKIYLAVFPVFRSQGYDDIQYGSCAFAYCDVVSFILTFLLSLIAFYLIGSFIARIWPENGK